jgi:hypothetical protein
MVVVSLCFPIGLTEVVSTREPTFCSDTCPLWRTSVLFLRSTGHVVVWQMIRPTSSAKVAWLHHWPEVWQEKYIATSLGDSSRPGEA